MSNSTHSYSGCNSAPVQEQARRDKEVRVLGKEKKNGENNGRENEKRKKRE
tara:strand:+ start:160 stop:312 length:153 start_codon:yes stop_codon:yes gene_type:complete